MWMEDLNISFPVFLLALEREGQQAGGCCLTVLHPQIFDPVLCRAELISQCSEVATRKKITSRMEGKNVAFETNWKAIKPTKLQNN